MSESDKYRHQNGRIEMHIARDVWVRSAHDEATADELPEYEEAGHPATAALREKFAVEAK